MSGNWKLAIMVGLVTLAGTFAAKSAESADEALLKALTGAKITLLQGIAQVAKGTEVPTEAKYERDKGKLALTVYTSAKGFDTPAEDNSFNEYGGDATAAAWKPDKEVFADLKHIARSAQYHTLLSMTKMTSSSRNSSSPSPSGNPRSTTAASYDVTARAARASPHSPTTSTVNPARRQGMMDATARVHRSSARRSPGKGNENVI